MDMGGGRGAYNNRGYNDGPGYGMNMVSLAQN
jgi:hypothetical protein